MALSGQINVLSEEIRNLLEDGLETTGFVCVDGAPSWGGTGTGEDFSEIKIYATNLDDLEEDKNIKKIPCIEFRGDSMPVEYFNDAEVIYQADFVFEISIPIHHKKIIDSTTHRRNPLMNWYLERLEYVLDKWTPQTVMHSGKMNTGSMNMGKVSSGSDMIYYGQLFLSVSFASDGGNI